MVKKAVYSFEDLEVYKLAREFSNQVSQLIKKLPKEEEYNLKGQMRRAKLSMTNNIAEGFGRFHFQENIQFCRQSRHFSEFIFQNIGCNLLGEWGRKCS
jgi:hypothetical protein